jgi:hypothetical protein
MRYFLFCAVWCNREEPPDSNCLQEEDAVKLKKSSPFLYKTKKKIALTVKEIVKIPDKMF